MLVNGCSYFSYVSGVCIYYRVPALRMQFDIVYVKDLYLERAFKILC